MHARHDLPPASPRLSRLLKCSVPVVLLLSVLAGDRATRGSVSFDGFYERTVQASDPDVNIYKDVRAYAPCFYAFLVPFTLLPMPVAAGVWSFLVGLLAVVAAWWLARLLTNDPSSFRLVLAVTLVVIAPIVVNNLVRSQNNILVLFLAVAAMLSLSRGRDVRAGLALAVATAFKLTPAFLAAYLVALRRWRALAVMGAATVALIALLPLAVFGMERGSELNRKWWKKVVVAYAKEGGEGVFDGSPYRDSNQSAKAAMVRLLSEQNVGSSKRPAFVNVASLPPDTVGVLSRAFAVALLAVLAATALRHRRALGRSWSLEASVLGALFLLAMPMVSDISWTSHYVVAAAAVAAAAAWLPLAPPTHARWLKVAFAAAALLYVLTAVPDVKLRAGLFLAALTLFAALATSLVTSRGAWTGQAPARRA